MTGDQTERFKTVSSAQGPVRDQPRQRTLTRPERLRFRLHRLVDREVPAVGISGRRPPGRRDSRLAFGVWRLALGVPTAVLGLIRDSLLAPTKKAAVIQFETPLRPSAFWRLKTAAKAGAARSTTAKSVSASGRVLGSKFDRPSGRNSPRGCPAVRLSGCVGVGGHRLGRQASQDEPAPSDLGLEPGHDVPQGV